MIFEVHPPTGQDERVLVAVGELDVASAPVLLAAVAAGLLDPPGIMAIDVNALSFLDSSGVRSLVLCGRQAQLAGTEFHVVCSAANRRVHRVFAVLGLASALSILEIWPPAALPEQRDS
jgi:anti-anti-sigma factor